MTFHRTMTIAAFLAVLVLIALAPAALLAAEPPQKAGTEKQSEKKPVDPYAWKSLFDGKTLKGWKVPKFGSEGEVKVEDGMIVLGLGEGITGVTWTGEVPKTNYELSLEGKRLDGSDFFCTTTFPVGDSHCSFVTGGWGGGVVGLSSVDFFDASENQTTTYKDFKNGTWYRFRIRVSDSKLEAWIDDEKMVDLPLAGHKISTRWEVDLCKPLGISSWCTKGGVRNIRIRKLKPEEVKQIAEETVKE